MDCYQHYSYEHGLETEGIREQYINLCTPILHLVLTV
jgi:hypothetical protein